MLRITKSVTAIISILLLNTPQVIFAKSYVVGKLMGQLGNQMFIIAATTSLAMDNGAIPTFPDLRGPDHYGYNTAHNYERIFYKLNTFNPKISNDKIYQEPFYAHQPIPYKTNMAISGYFQSEKYFVNHKEEIIELFSPEADTLEYLMGKYQEVIEHPKTVAIHMRSYLKEDPDQNIHITYGIRYFQEAMSIFPEDSLFVVFSNDIESCKKEFAYVPRQILFIEGEDYIDDFYLMSLCKHNIICNSTFSWWAAYLNRNPNKIVVAPLPWFNPKSKIDTKDLLPKDWKFVQMSN